MFSLAGLWERWEKGEEPVETFTVLTSAASRALADIRHRQAVIVEGGGSRRVAGSWDVLEESC